MKISLCALLLIGCGSNPYAIDSYLDVTDYDINYTNTTREGIREDGIYDTKITDRLTDEVEACLIALYPDGRLPSDVVQASSCITSTFDPHIKREWIGVKVAPDWFQGCYDQDWQWVGQGNGEQMFPVDPKLDPKIRAEIDKLCEAKGFKVTPECPCGERAAVQGNSAIVVTPNMHLYKAELIRLVMGCNNIWTTVLASCYTAN